MKWISNQWRSRNLHDLHYIRSVEVVLLWGNFFVKYLKTLDYQVDTLRICFSITYNDMEKRMKQNKLLNLSAIFLRNLNSIDLVIKQSTWYNVLLFFVLPNWVSDEFFEGVQVVGDSIAPILGQYYVFRLRQLRWQVQPNVDAILFMFFVSTVWSCAQCQLVRYSLKLGRYCLLCF